VRCRYFLRVNIAGKGMTPDTKHDSTLWVRNFEQPTEAAAPIKVRAGLGLPLIDRPCSDVLLWFLCLSRLLVQLCRGKQIARQAAMCQERRDRPSGVEAVART